jgi:predicted TIM-barrel fold metal-dependent hydrolase
MLINAHTHVFTNHHLPSRMLYLPYLLPVINSTGTGNVLACLLRNFSPWTYDLLDRAAAYVTTGNAKSQKEIFQKLLDAYELDEKPCFVLLSLDFEYMGAGPVSPNYSFRNQLDELAELKQLYPDQVYPFFCADPRRKNVTRLARHYLETEGFCGIKLYPPFGYFPDDDRLSELYQYAVDEGLPVIGHAMPAAPFAHSRSFLASRWQVFCRYNSLSVLYRTRRSVCNDYVRPESYEALLNQFPKLKLCLAHAGNDLDLFNVNGEDAWFSKIYRMLRNPQYENLYVDMAFTAPTDPLLDKLALCLDIPMLHDRILYGSDYYMNVMVAPDETSFANRVREKLGEDNFRQITGDNARRFLNLPPLVNQRFEHEPDKRAA